MVWSNNLSDAQLRMVMESGHNERLGDEGYGVELTNAGKWATARALVANDLGIIEGGAPNGSFLPGLYFNNQTGVEITHEFDEDADDA